MLDKRDISSLTASKPLLSFWSWFSSRP